MPPAFVGGALSFKGEKKKKKSAKKKKRDTKHSLLKKKDDDEAVHASLTAADGDHEDHEEMTDAERKFLKRRREREEKELAIAAQKSHRERVEELNEKLSTQTEHNDIPRVSAAGNG